MGLGNNQTGWGTHWADFDHDSDLDLLIANGRLQVTNLDTDPQLVRFYRNRSRNLDGSGGKPGQFLDFTTQVGLKDVGPVLSRGSAMADYDNDGDLDIAINTITGDAVLLQNQVVAGNWLTIDLGGVFPGTRAMVELSDGRQLVREVYAGSSYLASEDSRIHFGIDHDLKVPLLVVTWGDGTETSLKDVVANQHLHLERPGDQVRQ